MKRIIDGLAAKYFAACRLVHGAVSRHSLGILLVIGGILLVVGAVETSMAIEPFENYDGTRLETINVGIMDNLVEGAFGALVMIVAGLIAIISAALGAYRAALAALVVAVGAFLLRVIVLAFFGTNSGL